MWSVVILSPTLMAATPRIVSGKGAHEGGAVETFLAEEERRYAAQLERYASVVRRLDARAVRTALYFPLLGAWRELGLPP